MLPKEEIAKYGGKAAILNHIKERIPDMPILPYVVKEYGKSIDTILSDFNNKPNSRTPKSGMAKCRRLMCWVSSCIQ
jgi:predicted nucleic acid-binding Zn ribbon protein